ncbi:MAG: glucoamylase family protein, partial [Dokdonella sp.]
SVQRLLARTQATFDTLDRLQRFRGHFYNWYDTRTLAPLPPRYVSTVDSGNLSGHLLTLRQGLLALESWSPHDTRMLQGIADTARVAQSVTTSSTLLASLIDDAEKADTRRVAGEAIGADLLRLVAQSRDLVAQSARDDPAGVWFVRLQAQCEEASAEYAALAADSRSTLAVLADAGCDPARVILDRAQGLAERAGEFGALDHEFLYDHSRELFHIGFNVEDHRRDAGYYDLLASEARLGIFVAIAKGEIPQKAWFSLGRLLIQAGGAPVLLSWSGSMFEYLMPNLVMPTYPQSLLESTSRAAVARQIDYGRERDVPWGVSECGYHLTDAAQNYQYRAFGVPGLGLQRGLSQELVIAPYATALGLLTAPNEAAANLQRMADQGWLADCGFYEAIDFTATRLPPGQRCAVVRSFMAHHQGMSLLAIGHVLFDRPMQRRFQADAHVQSALLLLQERVPRVSGQPASDPKLVDARNANEAPTVPLRVFNRPDSRTPAVQLLSNGRYHVMLSSAGGGYSRWRDLALTRWQEDATRDASGTFCYLRDVGTGRTWSTAFQPTLQLDEGYEAVFTESRVEFRRRLDGWETHTEIVVSPEDDIELRRTRITNRGSVMRTIEVTSYAEIVLAPPISDALHPAFSKLFVQTEIVRSRDAIICTRRPRDRHDSSPSLFHLLAVHDGESSGASFETDRARFLGRGRSSVDAEAIESSGVLSGSEGSVLDPVVAIRHRIRIKPEETVYVDLVIGVGRDREHCVQLADKYHDRRLADRVIDLAWTHSRVSLRQMNISEADAQNYARLAGCMLYSHAWLRADAQQLVRNRRSQSALWAYAISGDLPIILVRIGETMNLGLVRDAVQAHAYWRLKGVAADLVIWNEERGGYRQELHDAIMAMIAASIDANVLERPGGIFVRSVEQIPHEDRLLFLAVARVVLGDKGGTLSEHLHRRELTRTPTPLLQPSESARAISALPVPVLSPEPLQLDNGIGGFSANGREYVILRREEGGTPAPWINVIANRHFGFIISDSASSYTWRENAHEYRLTPWHNDPVSDSCGEAFYIRDEESGRFWSPAPLPAKGSGPWT